MKIGKEKEVEKPEQKQKEERRERKRIGHEDMTPRAKSFRSRTLSC